MPNRNHTTSRHLLALTAWGCRVTLKTVSVHCLAFNIHSFSISSSSNHSISFVLNNYLLWSGSWRLTFTTSVHCVTILSMYGYGSVRWPFISAHLILLYSYCSGKEHWICRATTGPVLAAWGGHTVCSGGSVWLEYSEDIGVVFQLCQLTRSQVSG